MEKVWKNLQKVIQKGGKNEEKTFKKLCEKRMTFRGVLPQARGERGAQQTTQNQQETYKPSTQTQQWAKKVSAKKVSEEGWV